jgi:phytoene desaturase
VTHPVVVVGGGLGGLAASIVLAAAGREVVLCEAGERLGGKAGVVEIDGVWFDTGPSVLTLPALLDDVFLLAGTSLADELTLLRPDPFFRYRFPDGVSLDVHHSPDDTRDSVRRALGADAAADFDVFLAYTQRIWEAAAPWFVTGPAPSIATLFGAAAQLHRLLPAIDPLSTLSGAIRSRVRSPHLRTLFQRYATYNGSDARTCPATLNCIAWVELGLGGFGVAGGMYAIVEAMERAARRLGVSVRVHSPVRRIRTERGRIVAVDLDDATLTTGAVVCNADVAHLAVDLLERPRGLRPPATPSMSGWTAVVRARAADRRPHEALFPMDYSEEHADIFDRDRPPLEPTVYICDQARAHDRPTWSDASPVFLMANAPPEPRVGARPEAVWSDLRLRVLSRAIAAGVIHPDDPVVWQRTPTALASRFPGTRGSLYGAASNSRFAAFKRPPNRWSAIPGLYLASGSAHPGGGVPLCVQSGRLAAEALLADRR